MFHIIFVLTLVKLANCCPPAKEPSFRPSVTLSHLDYYSLPYANSTNIEDYISALVRQSYERISVIEKISQDVWIGNPKDPSVWRTVCLRTGVMDLVYWCRMIGSNVSFSRIYTVNKYYPNNRPLEENAFTAEEIGFHSTIRVDVKDRVRMTNVNTFSSKGEVLHPKVTYSMKLLEGALIDNFKQIMHYSSWHAPVHFVSEESKSL